MIFSWYFTGNRNSWAYLPFDFDLVAGYSPLAFLAAFALASRSLFLLLSSLRWVQVEVFSMEVIYIDWK